MAELDTLFAEAVSAFKAGKTAEARDMFLEVVDQDEHHEQAWLYLSGLVDTLEEQQICLENVLAINPENQKAKKGLEVITGKLSSPATGTDFPDFPAPTPDTSAFSSPFSSLPTPTSGEASPASGSPPIGAEFATESGDSLVNGDSPAGGFDSMTPGMDDADSELFGWLSGETPAADSKPEAPPRDPSQPASSVDWGGGSGPAAYGSGKQVDLPSSQEYDDWVQGLNLGGLEDLAAQPSAGFEGDEAGFAAGGSGPFGDTSFMVDSEEPAPDASPGATGRPDPFEAGWGDEPDAYGGSPFAGGTFEESALADDEPSTFGAQAYESAEPELYDVGAVSADEEEDLRFDFDDEQEVASIQDEDAEGFWSDRLNSVAPRAEAPALATPETPAAVTAADYYRYIPGEIEVDEGGSTRRSLLMVVGILVLTVLNVASFAYMLA